MLSKILIQQKLVHKIKDKRYENPEATNCNYYKRRNLLIIHIFIEGVKRKICGKVACI